MKNAILPIIILFFSCFQYDKVEAQTFDYNILCSLQQKRTPVMNSVMEWTSNSLVLAPAIPSGFLVAGYSAQNQQLANIGISTGLSFVTAFAITEIVKYCVHRPRPYNGYPDDLLPVKTTLGYSFPSGHTSLTFAVATSLSLCHPKWYVIAPSMLWASGVAFSRLYLGVHYPSDVLSGMFVGVASGVFGYWLSQRMQEESVIPAPKVVTMPIVLKF